MEELRNEIISTVDSTLLYSMFYIKLNAQQIYIVIYKTAIIQVINIYNTELQSYYDCSSDLKSEGIATNSKKQNKE